MRGLLFIAFILFSVAGMSNENPEQQRIRQLEEKLRCLVCQNQTLADSNAELAGDLRRQVLEQVKAGKSDEQIIEYLVQRYGDFVLYRPPFKAMTALLWLGPLLLLLAGLLWLYRVLARRRATQPAPELPKAEHGRAPALLDGHPASR